MTLHQPFHTQVREERHFCAVLAHLLMEKGGNLGGFLRLVNDDLPDVQRVPAFALADAAVYVEFTMLRDQWNAVDGPDRRARLEQLMRRVPRLRPVADALPLEPAELNALVVGEQGRRRTSAAAFPGQWSVRALKDLAGDDQHLFRDLCRFKWSFNIKPDLVILLAGGHALCIEAKLESSTSSYPSSSREKHLFDKAFGARRGRVGQLELQRFMFDEILQLPTSYAVIAPRRPAELRTESQEDVAFVSWRDAFDACNRSGSVRSIELLISESPFL